MSRRPPLGCGCARGAPIAATAVAPALAPSAVVSTALGAIRYAVAKLGVPLVPVMGHGRCGAVAAAVDVVRRNIVFPGAIGQMIEPIVPAVLGVRDKGGALVENAVRADVSRVVQRLRTASEPDLLGPPAERTPRIVGAAYSLDTGEVDFVNEA
ncbi:carbonic anhydrase [Methylobacterium nonmethylotrophicum]|uniref:Carbonic anhydrase n=1 Tax=Methylobacterium nonmethylotrophicum TaxID=1141884 RepID=A0A4Z0NEN2_9HYPH|nr:carbonic anhydrase [Methylobacterium nonmethylotrophicum]TGD92886.1 hypothetical protein EU555_34125 [Methylobacterium nonmethylotrophicum]